MGMCVHKVVKATMFLAVVAFLGGCGAMDSILPSTGIYKVNVKVNGLALEDCSFVGSRDKIQPFFEESIFNDPDVSGLMVFLKDKKGEVAGWKIKYNLDESIEDEEDDNDAEDIDDAEKDELSQEPEVISAQNVVSNENSRRQRHTRQTSSHTEDKENKENENEKLTEDEIENDETTDELEEEINEYAQFEADFKYGDEIVFSVKNLNKDLPFFPIPKNVPMDRYTIVFNVLSGDEIIQKTEKVFFYLGNTEFSFEGIHVHFPGIAESYQFIPVKTVIMLSAEVDFDASLDPYIIWYDGKKIISEGSFSEGAGNLLWETPEQNGFFSLRAETFPIEDRQNFSGYQKDISLLISSKQIDMHFISEDTPDLVHLYYFEGALNDSKMKTSVERSILPKNKPKWMPAGEIYGFVAGIGETYTLPKIYCSNGDDEKDSYIFFRLKPLNEGAIFSIRFGTSDVTICVSKEDGNLVLTLASSLTSVSKVYALPENDGMISAGIGFSIEEESLSAQLNIMGMVITDDTDIEPVSIEANIDGMFEIILGQEFEEPPPQTVNEKARQPLFTALWDEIAVFQRQFTGAELNEFIFKENQPAVPASSENDDTEN